METPFQTNMSFEFVVASEHSATIAKRLLDSADIDERCVAKVVLEISELSETTRESLQLAMEDKANCELGPYFDHDPSDAVLAAQRLATSADSELRDLARVLLDQAKAIADSRASFLDDVRRLYGPEVAGQVGRGEWRGGPPRGPSSSK